FSDRYCRASLLSIMVPRWVSDVRLYGLRTFFEDVFLARVSSVQVAVSVEEQQVRLGRVFRRLARNESYDAHGVLQALHAIDLERQRDSSALAALAILDAVHYPVQFQREQVHDLAAS